MNISINIDDLSREKILANWKVLSGPDYDMIGYHETILEPLFVWSHPEHPGLVLFDDCLLQLGVNKEDLLYLKLTHNGTCPIPNCSELVEIRLRKRFFQDSTGRQIPFPDSRLKINEYEF